MSHRVRQNASMSVTDPYARLERLISAAHYLLTTSPLAVRRQVSAEFHVGYGSALVLEWPTVKFGQPGEFLAAIQYANMRHPFERVLGIDFDPGSHLQYVAMDREGHYCDRLFQHFQDADGNHVFQEIDPDPIRDLDLPAFFERPEAVVPSAITGWVDGHLRACSSILKAASSRDRDFP